MAGRGRRSSPYNSRSAGRRQEDCAIPSDASGGKRGRCLAHRYKPLDHWHTQCTLRGLMAFDTALPSVYRPDHCLDTSTCAGAGGRSWMDDGPMDRSPFCGARTGDQQRRRAVAFRFTHRVVPVGHNSSRHFLDLALGAAWAASFDAADSLSCGSRWRRWLDMWGNYFGAFRTIVLNGDAKSIR
jgi:hypothetical protein